MILNKSQIDAHNEKGLTKHKKALIMYQEPFLMRKALLRN